MNITFDIGNTRFKYAVFAEGNMLHNEILDLNTKNQIQIMEAIDKYMINTNSVIVSNVGKFSELNYLNIKNKVKKLLIVSDKIKLPFKNKYNSNKSIGSDRIALASGAIKKFSGNPILIIDIGTCITYDYLNENNYYFGGAISPGIKIRLLSLNRFTNNLPNIDFKVPTSFIGDTTERSILSGVFYGILSELDGKINMYQNKNSKLTVLLTGGDSGYFAGKLKNTIFVEKNLLLDGLNFLIEINE